jgi:FkbM family methyltransferase
MSFELNKLTDTRYGRMLYNVNDKFLGRSLELYGEWSQEEMDFLGPFIPSGGVCIDVGANIGTHTLFFANAVGKKGRVIAFEPQHIMFQLLCANIALNQHLNVRAYNYAVGDSCRMVRLPDVDYLSPYNFGIVSIQQEGGHPVQGMALDNVECPSLDLIKIDVEGWEPEVIQGAAETIRKHQPLIYAECHPTVHSQNLIKLIQSFDYDVYLHCTASFNPNNFKKNAENIHGDYRETNIFCTPRSKNISVDLPKMEKWSFL